MDLNSKTKDILEKYEIHPQKKFGQNFLINEKIVQDIVSAADISPNDTILEIGPGIGTITQELCQKAKKVIAVEKDEKMVEILKETLKEYKNVEIIQDDILKMNFKILKNYKIVGSLPFYIATHIIRQFLEISNKKSMTDPDDRQNLSRIVGDVGHRQPHRQADSLPKKMVLVVQKEVGKRICPPQISKKFGRASAKMNLLAVAVQFYADVKIIRHISKRAFSPQPKVDSAIIKITNIIPAEHEYRKPKFNQLFFKILKAGFAHPRKQLIGNLSKELNLARDKTENWLLENNIQPNQRAETLSVQDWINLARTGLATFTNKLG